MSASLKSRIRPYIESIPFVGKGLVELYRRSFLGKPKQFDSQSYWENRYRSGGNSGLGSYNNLAAFKAQVINDFVARNRISTVIEFGFGDGNQLDLANYPKYMGFDISPEAVKNCRQKFPKDYSKSFFELTEYDGQTAELTLSLDVIYHLVEDKVFANYMRLLFSAAINFVVIYSSNTDDNSDIPPNSHVFHRKFEDWSTQNAPDWKLIEFTPNRFQFAGNMECGSFADFYIYEQVVRLA